jgi:hypothetical protein
MDIIIATNEGIHCSNLFRELNEPGIEHRVIYCEDEPGAVRRQGIRRPPNLVVKGKAIYHKQPSEHEQLHFLNTEMPILTGSSRNE